MHLKVLPVLNALCNRESLSDSGIKSIIILSISIAWPECIMYCNTEREHDVSPGSHSLTLTGFLDAFDLDVGLKHMLSKFAEDTKLEEMLTPLRVESPCTKILTY